MSKIVLVVDDELRMRKLISDFLVRENYTIVEADNGETALNILSSQKIDLVILDVMMPKYDGWTVCKEIRKTSTIPIIMLTAKGEEIDQLFGFELGVDEYITKPFSPRVLTARVNALFRRIESEPQQTQTPSLNAAPSTSFAGLHIDMDAHFVSIDGARLDLTPKEYDLLIYLAENKGRALSREQILNQIWSYDYFGDLRTVDTHINRLRTKLGTQSFLIQTIRGFGYRFEVEQ
ncbi:MAG: two component transcriptional regulator, winged helix family [Firmicutes bacterium]|nr:two component transcriptional regulator, winged helix family [Bacillota bacterium]